jgi:regulator of RNase E activity RraA
MRAITCGGVFIRPGDLIVADGDGVICVPVEKARQVAEVAIEIQEDDKASRRKRYEQLGLPEDFTTRGRR